MVQQADLYAGENLKIDYLGNAVWNCMVYNWNVYYIISTNMKVDYFKYGVMHKLRHAPEEAGSPA